MGKAGKAPFRERRQDNSNYMHYIIQDHMKSSGFIILDVITIGVTLNA